MRGREEFGRLGDWEIDGRLETVEGRLETVEGHLETIEGRLEPFK